MDYYSASAIISGVAALIAGICWFWSASIKVPDNIDTIVRELQRAGSWNRVAATAAGLAAIFQCIGLLLSAWR